MTTMAAAERQTIPCSCTTYCRGASGIGPRWHCQMEKPTDYHAEMMLPAGKTCADCSHVARCVAIGYSWPERNQCDFYPSKFIPIARVLGIPLTGEGQ